MSAFKGTPGPWEVLNARKEDWIGRPLDYWTVTAEGHDKWLCASPEWDPEHDEESTANARLIAAAPELLAELEYVRTTLSLLRTDTARSAKVDHRWEGMDEKFSEWLERIDSAIAKATGGAA